jgi:hypothetical protein
MKGEIMEEVNTPNYGAVFKLKEGVEGLSRDEVIHLMDVIKSDNVYPIEIDSSEESTAMGFIIGEVAKACGYVYERGSNFYSYISNIVDEIDLGNTADTEFPFTTIHGVKILIYIEK